MSLVLRIRVALTPFAAVPETLLKVQNVSLVCIIFECLVDKDSCLLLFLSVAV